MAQRTITIDELKATLATVVETQMKWQARWTLGLMVGNGAALAALTSKFLDDLAGPQVALMFPSAWLFAIGLVSAGLTPAFDITVLAKYETTVIDNIAHIEQSSYNEVSEAVTPYKIDLSSWWLEIISAVSFAGGLFYPLVVLSLRYLRSGEFG